MRALREGHEAELRRRRQRRQYWRDVAGVGVVDGIEYTSRALEALELAGYLSPDEDDSKDAIARAISLLLANM